MSSMSSHFSSFNQNIQRVVQRYLWDPEPKNTDMNSIWCLGIEYPNVHPPSPALPSTSAPTPSQETAVVVDHPASPSLSTDPSQALGPGSELAWPVAFLDDFESRIWITYRSLLTTIRSRLPEHANGFTSDSGWGCMIRSGQSVLANTLQILHLGREWRRGMVPDEEKKLLALFADDPRAPFSIHKFVEHGERFCATHVGEWFGPHATAKCIQALANGYEGLGLRVYNSQELGNVYEEGIRKIAMVNGEFKPTLVLVSIRLGIDRVTPVYLEALKACVQLKQSVGIAGGRPSSSHYFVGVQSDYFFYLDPHTCRPLLPLKDDPTKYTKEEVDLCHTRRLRRINVRDMDPSMLLAFLIKDEEDLEDWRKGVEKVQGKRVVVVNEKEPPVHGQSGGPREEAIAEVEAYDESDEEGEGEEVKEDVGEGWVQ